MHIKKIPKSNQPAVPAQSQDQLMRDLFSCLSYAARTKADAEKIIESIKTGNHAPKLEKHEEDAIVKFMRLQNLENHSLLAECADENWRPFLVQFATDLIKEFDCKTSAEKALAQVAAGAFYRALKCSKTFNVGIIPEYLSPEVTDFESMLSKELDRAIRQFQTAIQTLKQMKQPGIKLNVRAETAYLAQNQQINTTPSPGSL